MLSSLLASGLLLLLIGTSYGIGRLFIKRLLFAVPTLERLIFAVPAGMGIIGMVVWVCGLMGLLAPWLFWTVLAAGGIGIVVLVRDLLFHPGQMDSEGKRSLLMVLAGVLIALLAVCTLVGALAPPSGLEWDSLSYHLANQKVWLTHGRIDFLPWDHHSNFPFVAQMLYLLMLGVGSVSGAKLVHWLCGMLLIVSVYTFCRRHFEKSGLASGGATLPLPLVRGSAVGTVAALIIATTPIVLWESTVAYVDLASALFTWLSLYALINAAEETLPEQEFSPASRGRVATTSLYWLILSAVMMGVALGTKYTVLGFWGMLLLGILSWNLALKRKWAKETLPHAALWGAISLALGLPWYIKNWLVAGNPVYPFGYSILGGKYWSVENARQYAEEQARFGFGKTPLDLLLSPWRVTNELTYFPAYAQETGRRFIFTEYMFFGLSPVFIALLLILPLVGRRLSRVSVYCLLFGLGVFAFWFFMMQQTRYLIPALPAFAVVAAEVIVLLWQEKKSLARYAVAGLLVVTALWGLYLAAGLAFLGLPFGGLPPALPVAAGQMTPDDYLKKTLPGLADACFWINASTAKTDKVAIFDETRGFYLDREYLWAQPDHAEGLLPWNDYTDVDDWLADFKKRGYTTLLLGLPPEQFPATDSRRWRSLVTEAIADGKVTLGFEKGPYRVYQIP